MASKYTQIIPFVLHGPYHQLLKQSPLIS